MNKLIRTFVIVIVLAYSFAYAADETNISTTIKTKKGSGSERVSKKSPAPQKKLPPCDVFLKDWGGRGGFTASGNDSQFTIAPPECLLVFSGGLFIPECEEDGKMVRQCEGGIKP